MDKRTADKWRESLRDLDWTFDLAQELVDETGTRSIVEPEVMVLIDETMRKVLKRARRVGSYAYVDGMLLSSINEDESAFWAIGPFMDGVGARLVMLDDEEEI